MVGNSTRQIAFAIETLFTEKEVLIQDHYEGGKNAAANRFLLNSILKRIEIEHYGTKVTLERIGKYTALSLRA